MVGSGRVMRLEDVVEADVGQSLRLKLGNEDGGGGLVWVEVGGRSRHFTRSLRQLALIFDCKQ